MTTLLTDLAGLPARLLRKIDHESAQARLVRDIRALTAGRRVAAGDGPAIGFATFGSGAWHLGIEVLLAHALAARGARPQLLLCDMPELPICDERTAGSRDIERCAGCVDDKRELLDGSGVPWLGLRSLVAPDALARAKATVAALAEEELESYCEGQWPIGQWLHVSASHFLRCDARGAAAEKIDARRRLLATAIVVCNGVERWLDTCRPDIVVAESGAHFMWRIALELARARGLPVICREMGKGGWDRHIYALNADAMAPDLSGEWRGLIDEPLTAAEEAAVDGYLEDLAGKTYVQRSPRADAAETISTPQGHRAIVAFTNVTWDLATAGRDVAFDGVSDWLGAAIRATALLPGTQLIIRAHPAEASVMTRERILDHLSSAFPKMPPHVTLVQPEHPARAAELIDRADLVLAYNSTAGLEAVMRGRPTIVSGRPHFRGKGFTTDVSTRAEFSAALATARLAAPASMRARARRYFHLFYLRYHVPMGWTTSPLEPPYELLIRSLDELQPGRNAALDVVCDGILRGRQIVMPRTPEEVPSCRT
jgi:hypothetical protein